MESEALFITNQEKVGLEKNGIKKRVQLFRKK